jgi:Putative Actinobacterial Holin-X, holin superfamily III
MSQVNGPGAEASGPSTAAGPPPGGARRPIGVVVASVVDGAKTLIRNHVELAKIEAGEAVGARAKGAGLMGAAGVLALFAFGFVALSGSAALDLVLPAWAAHLIVAVVIGVIGWVLVLAGRRAIRTAPTPQLTQEALKEDARWAKRQLAR